MFAPLVCKGDASGGAITPAAPVSGAALTPANSASTKGGFGSAGIAGVGARIGAHPSPCQDIGGLHRPAVLEWKDLSYAVAVNQGSRSGARALSVLLGGGGCRRPKLAVLSRVSGFAGPRGDMLVGGRAVVAGAGASAASVGSGVVRRTMSSGALLLPTAAAAGPPAALESGGGGDRTGRDHTLDSIGGCAADFETSTMPSTVTGILGPSGAGKSSLLDVLAGRKRHGEGCTVGRVALDVGRGKGGRSAGEVRRVAGYVPQENVLPETLTCYEHLMFHARLKMPRGATHADRRARALVMLEELGLTRVADSRVGDALRGGLSGGEKRRLSIAAELMARPVLLFLDEPTTGLGERGRKGLR